MKGIMFFSAVALLFCGTAMGAGLEGETPTRSISVEGLGVHTFIGLNYDARLRGNYGWGYRVGIGYGGGGDDGAFALESGDSYLVFPGRNRINGFGIPLEVNYLVGKKRHHLELGVGANLGYYRNTNEYLQPNAQGDVEQHKVVEGRFGYFMFGSVGYRLQSPRGFQIRLGVTPSWSFNTKNSLSRSLFFPYLSLGWSF